MSNKLQSYGIYAMQKIKWYQLKGYFSTQSLLVKLLWSLTTADRLKIGRLQEQFLSITCRFGLSGSNFCSKHYFCEICITRMTPISWYCRYDMLSEQLPSVLKNIMWTFLWRKKIGVVGRTVKANKDIPWFSFFKSGSLVWQSPHLSKRTTVK